MNLVITYSKYSSWRLRGKGKDKRIKTGMGFWKVWGWQFDIDLSATVEHSKH